MAKKTQKVISESEAKEILSQAANQIQLIDERIDALKGERKEIVKNVKDAGLSVKVLNKAIREVREEKKNPQFAQEVDLYIDAIKDVIKPL